MGGSEPGSEEAGVDFTGISSPGYMLSLAMCRGAGWRGSGVTGYYGTCIQSYKHTLLSSSGPICMYALQQAWEYGSQ